MKFSLAALVFAVAVQAQSLKDIPACAIPCLEDSIKKTTPCDSKDLPCVCKSENFNKIRGDAAPCVIGKCGAQVGKTAQLPREVKDSVEC